MDFCLITILCVAGNVQYMAATWMRLLDPNSSHLLNALGTSVQIRPSVAGVRRNNWPSGLRCEAVNGR